MSKPLKLYPREATDGLWVHYRECDSPSDCRDTHFRIRRPDTQAMRELSRKHRKTRFVKNPAGQWTQIEEVDDDFTMEWVKQFVLDWRHVFNADTGEPVPFSHDALLYFLRSGEVVDFLLEVLRAANLDDYAIKEAAQGN